MFSIDSDFIAYCIHVFHRSNAAFVIIVATLELSLHPPEVLSEIDVDLE